MSKKAAARAGIRFRIGPKRPLLVVDVKVNGAGPFAFVLDTGASFSVITPRTAKAVGITPTGESPTAIGAGGRIEAGLCRLETFKLGAHLVRNLDVALMSLDEVEKPLGLRIGGLIGYNFLRQYVVTIDYPAKRLHLTARRAKRAR